MRHLCARFDRHGGNSRGLLASSPNLTVPYWTEEGGVGRDLGVAVALGMGVGVGDAWPRQSYMHIIHKHAGEVAGSHPDGPGTGRG